MKTFAVYLKDIIDPVTVRCTGFRHNGGSVELLSASEPSRFAYFAANQIVAILGELVTTEAETLEYSVYLQGKPEPLKIAATGFRIENGLVQFFFRFMSQSEFGRGRDTDVPDVYIRASEVIAIIPSDGLLIRDARREERG